MPIVMLLCLGLLIHKAQAAPEHSLPHLRFGTPEFICPDAIFAFGDSFSDTGELMRVQDGISAATPPYGMTFPGYPTGRFSDGRLVIDFLAEAFGFPLLDPYFAVRGTHSTRAGVNYATAGATARNTPIRVPLFLQAQVDQALEFQTTGRTASSGPDRGLYHIEIGGNDLRYALQAGIPVETITGVIGTEVSSNLSLAIRRLHNGIGARQFLVWNTPFIGCSDDIECLEGMHAVVGELNSQREATIKQLRIDLSDAVIIVADIHSFISNVTANPQNYGFTEAFRSCCGRDECGPESIVCEDPSQYVVWDGVHTTEALNKAMAQAIVNGKILQPSINLIQRCPRATALVEFGEGTPGHLN